MGTDSVGTPAKRPAEREPGIGQKTRPETFVLFESNRSTGGGGLEERTGRGHYPHPSRATTRGHAGPHPFLGLVVPCTVFPCVAFGGLPGFATIARGPGTRLGGLSPPHVPRKWPTVTSSAFGWYKIYPTLHVNIVLLGGWDLQNTSLDCTGRWCG